MMLEKRHLNKSLYLLMFGFLWIFMTCFSFTAHAEGPNLLQNNGFDANGATQNPANWITTSATNDQDADYTEGGGVNNTYRLTHWKRTDYQLSTSQTLTNLDDSQYTLRAKAINGGGQSECWLFVKGYGGEELRVNLPTGYDQWNDLTIPDINVTTGQVTIGLWSNANGGDWCSLDNIEFVDNNDTVITPQLPDFYNDSYEPIPATILSQSEAESKEEVKVALIRQPNNKITYMIKNDDGVMEPFYAKAIETGFWDTRKDGQVTDWDDVLQGIKDMGANTMQLMVHWYDWEPEDGVYDYTFLDDIVTRAGNKGIKVYFVIFFHRQWNMLSPDLDFWAYHLEDKNGANYSIMWGAGNLNNTTNIFNASLEVFPEYWHPVLYPKLINAVTDLATHYKDSDVVIAYQLGNEEGFNYYLNNGNDKNPYYQQMFTKWKEDTGKTNEGQFRKETTIALYERLTTAVHEVDPYKPTTTNFQGGLTEKIGGSFNWNDGMSASFYNDANLDMVGTMFYGNDGYKIWNNLDPLYNYTTELAILFPSEIGGRGTDSINMKTYLMNTLERGAQGFGIYCYGEMLNTIHYTNLVNMLTMINASEDILFAGMPVKNATGATNVYLSTTSSGARLSTLEKDDENALGLLYYNDVVRYGTSKANVTPTVNIQVKESGNYAIETYVSGQLASSVIETITAQDTFSYPVSMNNYATSFIIVRKTDEEIPTNVALGKIATASSEETAHDNIASKAVDGLLTTRWCAANGTANQWWQVDLGSTYNLSNAKIHWEFNKAYQYKIETSIDGTTWELAVDQTANTTSKQVVSHDFSGTGRYVRITITGGVSNSTWASFFECQVYGTP